MGAKQLNSITVTVVIICYCYNMQSYGDMSVGMNEHEYIIITQHLGLSVVETDLIWDFQVDRSLKWLV